MKNAWLGLMLIVGCSDAKPATDVRIVRDWRGKDVSVPLKPVRIVSIVPSCTELLYAVGAGPQVAGVTKYCAWPPEAAERPKVGDLTVNFEVLRSIQPDLVLAAYGLTKRSVDSIEAMGIPVFSVEPASLADIARALRVVGEITGHAAEGETAAREVESRVAAVERRVAGKPRPTVVIEVTSMIDVAVPGTYGHDVIEKAGGRNAFEDMKGSLFAAVSWEAIVRRDPDVYILAHEDADRPPGRAGFGAMRASKRFHEIAPAWLIYPTPRLVRGLELVAEKLHP